MTSKWSLKRLLAAAAVSAGLAAATASAEQRFTVVGTLKGLHLSDRVIQVETRTGAREYELDMELYDELAARHRDGSLDLEPGTMVRISGRRPEETADYAPLDIVDRIEPVLGKGRRK